MPAFTIMSSGYVDNRIKETKKSLLYQVKAALEKNQKVVPEMRITAISRIKLGDKSSRYVCLVYPNTLPKYYIEGQIAVYGSREHLDIFINKFRADQDKFDVTEPVEAVDDFVSKIHKAAFHAVSTRREEEWTFIE